MSTRTRFEKEGKGNSEMAYLNTIPISHIHENLSHDLVSDLLFVSSVEGFSLTDLHTNDNHGRFEETDTRGFLCSSKDAKAKKCFGGMARRFR